MAPETVDLNAPDDIALADKMNAGRKQVIAELQKRIIGHPDDQAVAADEEREQDQLDDVRLPDDALLQLGDDLLPADFHLAGQRDVVG